MLSVTIPQTTSLVAHIMPDDPAGLSIVRKVDELSLMQRAALVDILEQGEESPLTVEQYNSMLGKMAERTLLELKEEDDYEFRRGPEG